MAVYPDKIILKETTDSAAAIVTAIEPGGSNEIAYGELVVGRESGKVRLWALDANGDAKAIGGAESIDALNDVDTTTSAPVVGQTLIYQPGGQWKPANISGSGTIAKRVEEVQSTSSLADNASADVTYSGIGQSGNLISVATSVAAEVVLYPTSADRAAGTNSTYTVTTTGLQTVVIDGDYYYNDDTVATSAIYAKITNKSGSTSPVSVTVRAYADSAGDVFQQGGASIATASIADGAVDNLTMPGTGRFGEFIKITTSHACWVTFYCDQASRTADSTRLEGDDPLPGSGVLLEVITTASKLAIPITPSAAYFNSEATPLPELYMKVVNKSGSARAITITSQVLPIQY